MARRKAEERAKREEEAQRQAEEKKRREEEDRKREEEERIQREREEAERLQKQVSVKHQRHLAEVTVTRCHIVCVCVSERGRGEPAEGGGRAGEAGEREALPEGGGRAHGEEEGRRPNTAEL